MRELSYWLGIIGIPSVFALTSWCVKACITFYKKLDILASAQKAQMRGQLLDQFYAYKEQNYVYRDQLDEWINQFDSYHQLVGKNGVLDSRKDEILKIPVKQR